MFETSDDAEAKIPPLYKDPSVRRWDYVRLPSFVPWFYVSVGSEESADALGMYLIYDVSDFVEFVSLDWVKNPKPYLMLPPRMSRNGRWIMEELNEIWEAEEPKTRRHTYIFGTRGGSYYGDLVGEVPLSSLRYKKKVYGAEKSGINSSHE